jgi:hypothetical protein
MKTGLMATCALALTTAAGVVSSNAGAVRISFLTDDQAVKETVALLRSASCAEEGISSFRIALDRYNATLTNLNLSKFPEKEAGFYAFDSMPRLVRALPCRLSDMPHDFQLNCFDALILFTTGQMTTNLRIDAPAGPFLMNRLDTNGVPEVQAVGTARDAFEFLYPPWYIENTKAIFSPSRSEERACLLAAIGCLYALPFSTSPAGLQDDLLRTLRWGWRRNGLEFPGNGQVVLGHLVKAPWVLTDHAGVLFQTGKRCTYLEKAGGKGPFVRLELEDKADLLTWLAAHMEGGRKYGYTDFFATFNATEIRRIPVPPLPVPENPGRGEPSLR